MKEEQKMKLRKTIKKNFSPLLIGRSIKDQLLRSGSLPQGQIVSLAEETRSGGEKRGVL